MLLGQAGPGPAQSSGPGLAQKRIFLGRDRPNTFFGPTSAHHCFGLSPAQWFGPAQPDLILYFIYIYYILYYIYIYIYMKNYKNYAKIIEKYMCFCCNFIIIFWLILVGILFCKDTKLGIKIPGFHQNIKDFQNKKCLLLSKIF